MNELSDIFFNPSLENAVISSAFEQARIALGILASNGTFLRANHCLCELVGSAQESLDGLQFDQMIHSKDLQAYRQAIELSFHGTSTPSLPIEIFRKDGEKIHIELSIDRILAQSAPSPLFVISIRELSRDNESLYNDSLFLHNPAMILSTNAEGVITNVNPAAENLTGYERTELVGSSSKALLCEGQEHLLELYNHSSKQLPVTYEARIRHKNGDTIELGVKNVPIMKNGGVAGFYVIARDITESKRQKELKEKAEQGLLEAKEQFESLFRSSPTAIDLVDTEGRVIRVNPAHEALYGWTNKELAGKMLPVYPDNRQDENHSLMNRLREGRQILDLETERIRKDGTLIKVLLTVAPLKDREGKLVGYTGLTKDITEIKKTDELLRRADKLSVVGQLAAGMAHEIRNPLTSIRGFIQLLRSGHQEKEQFYDLMMSELDRINKILSELLIIAKPQVTSFERRDLVRMLSDVLELLMPQALLQSIEYQIEFDQDHIAMCCSEFELKQVFINLIKNGMEAMPLGGVISVRLTVRDDKDVLLRITDQGVGIAQDRIQRLGEPFYTTKEKGTGLGLMMCYKIIEAHHGTIHFTSKENAGTTVEVVLPKLQR